LPLEPLEHLVVLCFLEHLCYQYPLGHLLNQEYPLTLDLLGIL
jgi:hypothetical protein